MDCIICFNIIKNSAITNCGHHFCNNCIKKWCKFSNILCPKCRDPIYELKLDSEFDYLNKLNNLENNNLENNNLENNNLENNNTYYKIIDFKNNTKFPGITIKSHTQGLLIVYLKQNGRFYDEGLIENDVIVSINNIPITNHEHAINIINSYYHGKRKLILELLKKHNNNIFMKLIK